MLLYLIYDKEPYLKLDIQFLSIQLPPEGQKKNGERRLNL